MFNIYLVANSMRTHFMECATEQEAIEMCESYGWEFRDENGFMWRMEVDE